MVRRYDEPIEVRTTEHGERVDPDLFVWRGRLFSVRAVQERWHERRSWWRELESSTPPATQRRVWRVEASVGAGGIPGVFDLGSDGATGTDGPWVLLRSQD